MERREKGFAPPLSGSQRGKSKTWNFGLDSPPKPLPRARHVRPYPCSVHDGRATIPQRRRPARPHPGPGSRQEAGPHEVLWDGWDDNGARSPAGVYFSRLQADSWSSERKLVVIQR